MSRVLGWDPSQQGVERELSRLEAGQVITYSLDLDNPSATDTPNPPFKIEEVVLKRRPKKGDPDYVPRPQNCFMIFRNGWVRRNARGPDRSRGNSTAVRDKGMSKRAGEAWRALSQSERNHYEALANQEKIEHAQAHPDYRYNPKGSHTRGTGVSKAARRRSRARVSGGQVSSNPGAGDSFRDPKPRSSSVPLRFSAPSPFLLGEDSFSGALRRSRSHAMDIQPPFPAPSETIDSQGGEYSVALEHSSFSSHRSEFRLNSPSPLIEYPCLTMGSSSLAGWNGEPVAPIASPFNQLPSESSTLLTSTSSSWRANSPLHVHDEDYRYQHNHNESFAEMKPPESGVDHFGMPYAATPTIYWAPRMYQDPVYDVKAGYDAPYAYSTMQENALNSFNLGLANEVSAPGDFMPFNMPYADEQRVYEEYSHTQY